MSALVQVTPAKASAAEEQKKLKTLLYQINHVFLPPKLPQESDKDAFQDRYLVEMVRLYLGDFNRFVWVQDQKDRLDRCAGIMDRLIRTRDNSGYLDQNLLKDEMGKLGIRGS
jgi:hypothetical protein